MPEQIKRRAEPAGCGTTSDTREPAGVSRRRAVRWLGAGLAAPALSGCTAATVLSELEEGAAKARQAETETNVDALRDQGRALLVANMTARFGRPDDIDAIRGDSALSFTFGRLGETYRSETIGSEIGVFGVDPWFFGSVRAGSYFLVSFAVRKREAKYSASPGLPTFLDPKSAPAIVEFKVEAGQVLYLGHIMMHLDALKREYFVETRSFPEAAREALTEARPTLVGALEQKLFQCNGCPRF